ncbi:MAG: hypothetical protein AAGA56_16220 [Myxococcota bacterium]
MRAVRGTHPPLTSLVGGGRKGRPSAKLFAVSLAWLALAAVACERGSDRSLSFSGVGANGGGVGRNVNVDPGTGGGAGAGGADDPVGGVGGSGNCDGNNDCDACVQCQRLTDCSENETDCLNDPMCDSALLCLQNCTVSCDLDAGCYASCSATCMSAQLGHQLALDYLSCLCSIGCRNDCAASNSILLDCADLTL